MAGSVACTGRGPRPSEFGAEIGKLRLPMRCNSSLRQIIYTAVMGVVRSKVENHLYTAIRERGHSSTTSFNILARRLAGIAWEALESGRDFDPALPQVGSDRSGRSDR